MRHYPLALALLGLALCGHAIASDEWADISETDGAIFGVKIDSFVHTTNKGGERIGTILGRSYSKRSKTIIVEKWYVSLSDCATGYGKLVSLELDGSYKNEDSFVRGDGSAAATIALFICNVSEGVLANQERKSI